MNTDPFDLTGRRALVYRRHPGIGFAVAAALAAKGTAVCITGRKADTVNSAVEQLKAGGADVRGVVCHQGDPAAVEGLFAQLDADGFVADVVVVNAATNPVMGPLVQTDLDAWKKILDVNLTGSFLTAKAAAVRMTGKGSIVFMASIAGVEPIPGLGAYSVSKAGIMGLMRALARELGPVGVRVNAIAPGLVETRFAQALFQDESAYQELIGRTPLRRHGQPDDIAGAALFLASDASAYMTGQTLIIDGGGRV